MPGQPDNPRPADVLNARRSQLIDFGKQGGMSRMKEAPGGKLLVKELPMGGPDDWVVCVNEAFIGGILQTLPFVTGLYNFKPYKDGVEEGMQLFIPKIHGELFKPPTHPDEVARVGRELSAKMAQVAEREVVLVDVKPANLVKVAATGEYQIIDFGVAVREGFKPIGATFEYASPDVFNPNPTEGLDSRHDVYCLASTLAEGLLGKTPNEYYGGSAAGLQEGDARFAQMAIALRAACQGNARLADILILGLQPNKDKRPDMKDFANLLEQLSPQFRSFPKLTERDILDARTIKDIGRILGRVFASKIIKTDNFIPREEGHWFEETNLDKLGAVARAKNSFGSRDEDLVRFFKQLGYTLELDLAPIYFERNWNIQRPMTPREREAVRFVYWLYNKVKDITGDLGQFINRHDESRALFIDDCLRVLVDQNLKALHREDQMSHDIRLNPYNEWGNVQRELVAGFQEGNRP